MLKEKIIVVLALVTLNYSKEAGEIILAIDAYKMG